jgi:hypothetical protein
VAAEEQVAGHGLAPFDGEQHERSETAIAGLTGGIMCIWADPHVMGRKATMAADEVSDGF